MEIPETRCETTAGGVAIAYQVVVGTGPTLEARMEDIRARVMSA